MILSLYVDWCLSGTFLLGVYVSVCKCTQMCICKCVCIDVYMWVCVSVVYVYCLPVFVSVPAICIYSGGWHYVWQIKHVMPNSVCVTVFLNQPLYKGLPVLQGRHFSQSASPSVDAILGMAVCFSGRDTGFAVGVLPVKMPSGEFTRATKNNLCTLVGAGQWRERGRQRWGIQSRAADRWMGEQVSGWR